MYPDGRLFNANTKDAASGYAGYVTRFSVKANYINLYQIQTAGCAGKHLEYSVPAEELEEFNENIVGKIGVIAEFKSSGKVT